MKKKLEAELISIAHRILKMKNRSELDQLQAETLKLYEKISVLRFVEDNFADAKPTIGYASAEGKLEEIYGIEDTPEVHANEVEAEEEKARAERKSPPAPEGGEESDPGSKTDDKKGDDQAETPENSGSRENKTDDIKQDKENESGEGVTAGKDEAPVAEAEEEQMETSEPEAKPEGDADPNQKVEEYQASEEEKEHTEKETGEEVKEEPEEDAPAPVAEPEKAPEEPKQEAKEEEKKDVPAKQKEITFEDYHDYKEPEFVKKTDVAEPVDVQKEWLPKEPEAIQKQEEEAKAIWEEPKQEVKPEEPVEDDWRNWEPNKQSQSQAQSQPTEAKKEEPKAEADDWRNWEPNKQSQPAEEKKEEPKPMPAASTPAAPKPLNDSFGKTITLALNDRIAFEKHLFGGSSEDLNRVISQVNTQNSFDEAKAFIEDLVKPDYNNWQGKEEYETRFMELVEKRFS